MYCEKCGNAIEDDSIFCENCENKVRESRKESSSSAFTLVVSVLYFSRFLY